MSSTNINVGLLEGRNSSRVLKPPGGGHSDIFGRDLSPEKPRAKYYNTSSISACISQDSGSSTSAAKINGNSNHLNGTAPAADITDEMKPTNGSASVDTSNNINESNGDEVKPKEENKVAKVLPQSPPPQKVRVPPGGFSSGFW